MTKEELAKKRGITIQSAPRTAAESLVTTMDPLKKEEINVGTAKEEKVGSKSAVSKTMTTTESMKVVKKQTAKKKDESSKRTNKPKENVSKSSTAVSAHKIEITKTTKKQTAKKKVGRPKTRTEEVKLVNIAIPVSLYNSVSEYALALYNGNMTEYINELVKNDMDKNLKTYKTVYNAMAKAKGNK